MDQDYNILLANPLAEKYLTTLADASVGSKIEKIGDRPIQELLAPLPQGLKHEIQTEDYLYEILARPMMGDTVSDHWLLELRDITKEREIQKSIQRQERLAAVGQLAAGIAHDFNNILAVIILYTDMLNGQKDLPLKVHERLQTISEQAHLATGMIQQILDFSRRAILERQPMNLVPFVKEQVKLLERTLPENIKVELTYDEHEYLVNADPTRMQQVFMNLAVNARDAMPNGGKLHIRMDREEYPNPTTCEECGHMLSGDFVHINLSDSGYGISGEIMPRIFEPFFTTKEPGQGTGLGLSQVYGIIMQHEGHIHVKSRIEKGASFDIYLPILNALSTPMTITDAGSLHSGNGELILVVEDEGATRKALVDSLTLLNYRVRAVNDGEQALNFIEIHSQDLQLILSDVVMPEMGGVSLFRTLRAKKINIPVILMTGHPIKEDFHGLQSEGLAAWLQKPTKLKELSRVIAQVLTTQTH